MLQHEETKYIVESPALNHKLEKTSEDQGQNRKQFLEKIAQDSFAETGQQCLII